MTLPQTLSKGELFSLVPMVGLQKKEYENPGSE